jgi:hypothetical protein
VKSVVPKSCILLKQKKPDPVWNLASEEGDEKPLIRASYCLALILLTATLILSSITIENASIKTLKIMPQKYSGYFAAKIKI